MTLAKLKSLFSLADTLPVFLPSKNVLPPMMYYACLDQGAEWTPVRRTCRAERLSRPCGPLRHASLLAYGLLSTAD